MYPYPVVSKEIIEREEIFIISNGSCQASAYLLMEDSLVAEIKKEEKYHVDLSRLKASPQWAGYSRYFRIGDIGVSLVYDTEKWKNVNSPSTPFWVIFGNVNDNWRLDDDFKKALLKIETEKRMASILPCLPHALFLKVKSSVK